MKKHYIKPVTEGIALTHPYGIMFDDASPQSPWADAKGAAFDDEEEELADLSPALPEGEDAGWGTLWY